ncbi:MAG TPA: hypothetical protein VGR78_19365 [Verrucomicrobiae bacterium]|nr:hypothetical protein [Verrucomicrobiae bacterium]
MRPAPFFPQDPTKIAERQEINRGRKERRQLRLQNTDPEQVCFVGAAQIGQLQSGTINKGKASTKSWPIITSADPKAWSAKALLQARRDYWGIEGVFHQRLDATLDEDRSRTRTSNGLTVLGMFRRLAVSLATAWLTCPKRKKQKKSTRDFQEHLRENGCRRAFALVISLNPKAWHAR